MRWDHASDRALLRHAGDNPAAFETFYRRHEAVVATYLHRRTRDPHQTADLAAEVFAQALSRPEGFAGEGSAVGWLLGIARHLHLRQLRSGAVERRAVNRLGGQLAPPSDATAARLDRLLDDDARELLLGALAELPEEQRSAIVSYVIDELSYAELADAIGIPEATVRKRVSRGLGRLRTAIGERP